MNVSCSDWADAVNQSPLNGSPSDVIAAMRATGHAAGVPVVGGEGLVLVAQDGRRLGFNRREWWFEPVDGHGDALPYRGLSMAEILCRVPVGAERVAWCRKIMGMSAAPYKIYVEAMNTVMRSVSPPTATWWDPAWNNMGAPMWLAPLVLVASAVSSSNGDGAIDDLVDHVEKQCGPWEGQNGREETRFRAAVNTAKSIYGALQNMRWYQE